jgi:diacylglycerol kinase family enzyme
MQILAWSPESICILLTMDAPRRFRILLNASSGAGQQRQETMRQHFARRGCSCEITRLTRRVDLQALASRDDAAVIWLAAGGDGTVNCVAHAVAGSERVMGVIPCGTLNHFAQDMQIPDDLEHAVDLAAYGSVHRVDAAEVNGQIFVNNSSLGFYPAMVADRDRMKKRGLNKWWSLAVASARAFARFPCVQVELEVNGTLKRQETPLLFVGNNSYATEAGKLGRRERMDMSVLSLAIARRPSRTAMLRLLAATLAGRAAQTDELECLRVTDFTVNSRKRHLRVSYDGEMSRMRTPLRYRTRPAALRVIAPPEEQR